MGRASNTKMMRRGELIEARREMRLAAGRGLMYPEERDEAVREKLLALAENPELVAHQQACMADEELQARWRADLPGQAGRLRRAGWRQAFEGVDGAGGWAHQAGLQMIHSVSREPDGGMWGHLSVKRHRSAGLPSWEQLRDAQWLLYPDLPGVQVVAPRGRHVNIAEVLHVWTRLDVPAVPDFGRFGTI